MGRVLIEVGLKQHNVQAELHIFGHGMRPVAGSRHSHACFRRTRAGGYPANLVSRLRVNDEVGD